MLARQILSIALALIITSAVALAVPGLINYQGHLSDGAGNPIDADVSITFTIYDAATNGLVLWTETRTVTVTDGTFSVLLGSQTPIPANTFNGDARYLGVQAGGDAEMTPRQPIISVPYTFRADIADGMAANSVTGAMIANGTITFDKLADTCSPGQILKRTATSWDCGVPH